MSVIHRDFGKKARDTVQHFRERLSLEALHEANIRANPLPYLERAAERIFQLEKAIFEAAQLFGEGVGLPSGQAVTLDRAEYERLLRCREIVEKAWAEHHSDEEL
jgi:hypothetical protein